MTQALWQIVLSCWCSKRKKYFLAEGFGGDLWYYTVRIRESVDERRGQAGTLGLAQAFREVCGSSVNEAVESTCTNVIRLEKCNKEHGKEECTSKANPRLLESNLVTQTNANTTLSSNDDRLSCKLPGLGALGTFSFFFTKRKLQSKLSPLCSLGGAEPVSWLLL